MGASGVLRRPPSWPWGTGHRLSGVWGSQWHLLLHIDTFPCRTRLHFGRLAALLRYDLCERKYNTLKKLRTSGSTWLMWSVRMALTMYKINYGACTRRWLLLSRRWYERFVWQQILQVFHHLISTVLIVPAVFLIISSLKNQQITPQKIFIIEKAREIKKKMIATKSPSYWPFASSF